MSKSIFLNRNEIEILVRTIGVPLGAFGLKKLLVKANITKDECVRLSKILEEKRNQQGDINIIISSEDLGKLLYIFDISIEIVGQGDMHPIVGYTWDEAMSVSKKLHDFVKTNK